MNGLIRHINIQPSYKQLWLYGLHSFWHSWRSTYSGWVMLWDLPLSWIDLSKLSQLGTLTADSTTNGLSEINEDNSLFLNHIGEVDKNLKVIFHVTLFLVYVSISYRDAINSLILFAIWVTSELHMKKSQATLMLTTYFAAAAFGRLLSIIYSHWLAQKSSCFGSYVDVCCTAHWCHLWPWIAL